MNIKEFANMLNSREIDHEITHEEMRQARALGFVVVYGASDDLAEFCGAIYDEVGCNDGGNIYLNKDGLFQGCEHDRDCECKYLKTARDNCKIIEAVWGGEDGYSWTYKTDIPHATFEIMEDGEKYCRGIVFEIKELEEARERAITLGILETIELKYLHALGFKYIGRHEKGTVEAFKEMPVRSRNNGYDTWVIGSYPIRDFSLYGEIKLGEYCFITWDGGIVEIKTLINRPLDAQNLPGKALHQTGENLCYASVFALSVELAPPAIAS